MNELAEFTSKWTLEDYPPRVVDREDLDATERLLGLKFPMDYRFQVLKVGLPSPTLALLSAIIDRGVDLHDLSELYAPGEIVSATRDWRKIGIPQTLVAVGSDSLGNLFCFDEKNLQVERVAYAAVYHWDHDFKETEKMAGSFSDWIARYLGKWAEGIQATDF
ncbi:MAG: SMI1/KNR4 family protein [Pseudomonadota bacterium]